jgi:hypothetical protein
MAQGQQPQGYVLIAKDLNEFYVFSDALKKKNEELKTFVYKVSHDLKGPVASLIGLLELMHREKKDPHALESYLQMMQTSLQRLDKSIVSLLNFTLSTRTDLLPQQIYIHATIKEIIQSLQAFPGIHEVMIQNSIPEDICLSSIPEILQSVLQNFIENAIKYRSRFRQARVHISARWLHNHLSIRIEDNGIGMSPYVKARAFDMYFRGHAEAAGSGLGLYITKHGLEEIGGDVSIDSEEGKGTSILLSLPNLSR